MADSFTQQLRLLQQTDQANTNIWGNNWNDAVIDLSETAIAGRQNIDLTFTNAVLTMLNGAPDTSRAMFLHASGNPGVARTITVPSLQKVYVVTNETSPGFTVEVKTAANPGTVIAPGERGMVYVDQSNDTVRGPTDSGSIADELEAPFKTAVFTVNNQTGGDSNVTVSYQNQGGIIDIRIPVIDTTVAATTFILTPPGGMVPDDLQHKGPLNNEFPLCMEEAGVQEPAWLRVPLGNASWSFIKLSSSTWTNPSQRNTLYPLEFQLHNFP